MLRKLTVVLLLLTFGNLVFSGCTRMAVRSLAEVGSTNRHQINGVVTESGETIRFAPPGGNYSRVTGTISGLTEQNKRFQSKLDDLVSVYLVNLEADPALEMEVAADDLNNIVGTGKVKKIAELVTRDRERYTFDTAGGCVDAQSRMVVGTTRDGLPVRIPVDKVTHVKVKEFNDHTAGIVLGVVVLLGLTALSWANEWSGGSN